MPAANDPEVRGKARPVPDRRRVEQSLLTHPAIWAYPGETMRETMLAMLETEHERDLARLAEDRIDLT